MRPLEVCCICGTGRPKAVIELVLASGTLKFCSIRCYEEYLLVAPADQRG